jgi:hypothetical protein
MNGKFLIMLIAVIFSAQFTNAQDTLHLFGKRNDESSEAKMHDKQRRNRNEIQTLTGPGSHIGFYFGFTTGYSRIDVYDAVNAGASVALIANHSLAVGFSGKGFVSEPFRGEAGTTGKYNYAGGYGGLLIEPILFPKRPVHLSFPVLLGAGGIARNRVSGIYHPYDYDDFFIDDAEAFLIAEPGVEIEVNVARWLRMGMGVSYRIVSSFDSGDFVSGEFDGFNGGLSLKVGLF